MIQEGKHIIADKGKHFRRISSQEDYGNELYLGFTYYIGGVLQSPPHEDVAEDFEEVPNEDVELTDAQALDIITKGYETE